MTSRYSQIDSILTNYHNDRQTTGEFKTNRTGTRAIETDSQFSLSGKAAQEILDSSKNLAKKGKLDSFTNEQITNALNYGGWAGLNALVNSGS
ncbi:MAG: hypothetical protein SFU25_11875 [Candidatus Caenarcaniphilales bacterium]|nr:hypothetical protein [Candidatus Caenarcaniphilales bacterium]